MKRFGKTAARLAVRQTIRISRSAHIAQRPTRIFRLPYFPTQRQPENSPPTFRGWTTAALRSSISSGFAARNSQLETMPRIHDAMAARPSESKPSFQGAIAIIDDEENMCKVLVKILRMENYHVVSYMDPREALDQIRLTHPDVVLTAWATLVGPANMPPAVVEKIATAFEATLKEPAVIKYHDDQGVTLFPDMRGEKLKNFIVIEQAKFKDIVERAGITPE